MPICAASRVCVAVIRVISSPPRAGRPTNVQPLSDREIYASDRPLESEFRILALRIGTAEADNDGAAWAWQRPAVNQSLREFWIT